MPGLLGVAHLDATLAAALVGFALDLALGDPRWLPHPVVGIGRAISWYERRVRPLAPDAPRAQVVCGGVLAVGLPVLAAGVVAGALALCALVSPWLAFVLQTWLCYQLLATRELRRQTMAVTRALREAGLPAAREAVGRVVGRDVASLDEAGVTRAAVETVAENASDGVVAPLLYMMVGGAPAAMLYKAINTADSMIGYRSEVYLYFGRVAARLDDVANWVPARLSALLMIAASPLVGLSGTGALAAWRRDRRRHASPNAGQTEAVMAGALGVRLGGDASYFGTLVHKPTLGDDARPVEPDDVARANRLMLATALLALVVLAVARLLVTGVVGAWR